MAGDDEANSRPSVKLEDMIGHDDVLEKFPFLSAQIINKWRRSGAVPAFYHAGTGKNWYPIQDLNEALNANLQREIPDGTTE